VTPALSVEAAGRLAGDFYFSLDSALTLATLRAAGQRRTEAFEARMLRSHQRRFFLAGVEKLGLGAESSDAIRCARYHCLSNALGGLRMRYAVESPAKAWVFYETPSWLDSPWSPGMSAAIFRPQFMLGVMRAWHANNGRLLGNPGLVFVVTELTARGDGRDAGYFLELGEPAAWGDRLRQRFGEAPPPDLDLLEPDLDLDRWPPERQARAWRNYAVSYAAARISSLAGTAATWDSSEVIDLGLRTALFQRGPGLADALGLAGLPVSERCIRLLAGVHQLAGLEAEVEIRDGGGLVRVSGSWLGRAPEPPEGRPRAVAEAAIASAWAAWARHCDRTLSLQHRAQGQQSTWAFEQRRD
jgi:hypothetical protein